MAGTGNSGGHRQKTRQQHEIAGTFRKARHADLQSPEPTEGAFQAPAELDPVAQAEWDRMLWAFEDMGMRHQVDAFSVYQYCRLYAETEAVSEQQGDARESLKRLEENYPDLKKMEVSDRMAFFGHVVTLNKIVSKCTDQLRAGRMALRQYLVEFGLTPASRSRVKLTKKPATADAFASFQQSRAS